MKDTLMTNILVVDDEEEYRILTYQYVQKIGYVPEMASNASEAMEKLRSQAFDLVISDIRMEGEDGIQFMKTAREAFPGLDFIIMTGHVGDYSYSDIIEAGATDFISKPFDFGKLKSKLERIEREKRILREREEANRQLKESNTRLEETNKALSWEVSVNASLAALSEVIIGSSSIKEISNLLLKFARQLTQSPHGFVGYVDQRSSRLVCPTLARNSDDGAGSRNVDESIVFRDTRKLWGSVFKNRKSLMLNSVPEDSSGSEIPEGHIRIDRFLSVPARFGDAILGQVALANSTRDYTQKDLALAERLATVYALAVQRMWIQAELHQAKDHLENIFENAAEAIGIVDERGRFTKWNNAAEVLYGYSFEELKGKSFNELYADKEALGVMLGRLRQDGFIHGQEIEFRQKSGRVVPLRVSIRLLKDRKDKVIGSVAVATDLSDIRSTLMQLELANEKLQGEVAERERVAEELRKARDELEKLVIERTERLSRAGSLLKSSIDRFKEIAEE